MPGQYAPLPNPRNDPVNADDEMDAAFDDSDDESIGEDHPLRPTNTSSPHRHLDDTHIAIGHPEVIPGTYDFENVDYDYPPPGSPPRRDRALPDNDLGNSNGVIPTSPVGISLPRIGWFRRAAGAILPTHYSRLPTTGAVGGGTRNDGVFANVTAKPTLPRQLFSEDDPHVSPEDAQKDAPPSYSSAQADAVPPYWETTVHAPSSPGAAGEMVVDGLPTGVVFSFLWNLLISISFQFVGFLLTYLMHTTHAAKFGSRAGLGVTLIQYGFTLRAEKNGDNSEDGSLWGASDPAPSPVPSFPTAAAAEAWHNNSPNATTTGVPLEFGLYMSDVTSEWLAFLLMTIGWFLVLTSALGFWRVKRWERSIQLSNERSTVVPGPSVDGNDLFVPFERAFTLRSLNRDMFRQGLGLGGGMRRFETDEADHREDQTEDGHISVTLHNWTPTESERAHRLAEAIVSERRLQRDLRAAGLL
ncbi:hypothetical protein BD410DRAFT_709717 [Rickenella mellea]|uniref:Metal homeostatis protein bsd2 n=1 Tax=Rickenella mellea TaxID=50990 RepID=A0A4R5XGU5_9AGAM|nr:hypothetical protein BD410DRAFT_709717 [Rickenella mellea]